MPDSAFRIFVQRATAVRPAFDAAAHHAAIDAIVRLVDGLPLAVELAASQVRHLTPEMIQARLERSLPVLQGGQRDAPARHRTQRATLDWSHDLLAPADPSVVRQPLGLRRGLDARGGGAGLCRR